MEKITVEIEYEKEDVFGRTLCQVRLPFYSTEDAPVDCAENRDTIVRNLLVLFNDDNYSEQSATFKWNNDTYNEKVAKYGAYASRIHFDEDYGLCMVVQSKAGVDLMYKPLKKVTIQNIIEMFHEAVARARYEEGLEEGCLGSGSIPTGWRF